MLQKCRPIRNASDVGITGQGLEENARCVRRWLDQGVGQNSAYALMEFGNQVARTFAAIVTRSTARARCRNVFEGCGWLWKNEASRFGIRSKSFDLASSWACLFVGVLLLSYRVSGIQM